MNSEIYGLHKQWQWDIWVGSSPEITISIMHGPNLCLFQVSAFVIFWQAGSECSCLCLVLWSSLYNSYCILIFCIVEKLYVLELMFSEFFPTALRTVLKVMQHLPFCWDSPLGLAVSDYHGVIYHTDTLMPSFKQALIEARKQAREYPVWHTSDWRPIIEFFAL